MKGENYSDWNKHFRDWETDPQREGNWDSPSLGLWDKLAEDLPPPTPTPPRRRWWLLGFLGLALLVAMIIGLTRPLATVQLLAFPIPLATASPWPGSVEKPVEQATPAGAEVISLAVDTPAKSTSTTPSTTIDASGFTSEVAPGISVTPPARVQRDHPEQAAETTLIKPSTPTPLKALSNEQALSAVDTNDRTTKNPLTEQMEGQPVQLAPNAADQVAGETTPSPTHQQVEVPRLQLTNVKHIDALPTIDLHPLTAPARRVTLPQIEQATVATKAKQGLPAWTIATYFATPLDQGLQHTLRNWSISEQQRAGLGLSLQGSSSQGWFGQVGIQYETADYQANTRYLRRLNPAIERVENDQLVSDYQIDASLLKSSGEPATVTVQRSRNQVLPEDLRIIFSVENAVEEENLRVPLYLGRQFRISPQWRVQLQAGAVLNQTAWTRRTTSVTALVPNLQVREVNFSERVIRQESSSVQAAVGAGLQWQPHPHWQVGVQWQRIGTNQEAPQVLQQAEQQLLLGVGYRW